MAKIIDITDKLSFDENPKVVIKGKEFEVNADAETVLKMMGAFSSKSDIAASIDAFNFLFSEEDRKRIMMMKMSAKDLMIVIRESMDLILGTAEKEQ